MFELYYTTNSTHQQDIKQYNTLEDMVRDIVLRIGMDNVRSAYFALEPDEGSYVKHWQEIKVR